MKINNIGHVLKTSHYVTFLIILAAVAFFVGCKPVGGNKPDNLVSDEQRAVHECSSSRTQPDQSKIDKAASGQMHFDYRAGQLENGLNIITLQDFSCPIVSVQLWYSVGSKDERPDRTGFAHMFEHMMFKGTDLLEPKDHFNLIRLVGGTNNGYTSFDKTVYLETLPANQLELALWLEAERMAFLDISGENFKTERQVVEEELRMRHNEPYGTVMKKVAGEIFTEHPYRWMPIGDITHLRNTTVTELKAFWDRYYTPSNATLVVVGAVEHKQALELAEKYFGWIPKYPEPDTETEKISDNTKPHEIIIENEKAPTGLVGQLWKTIPHGHPDEIPLDMLSIILGKGKSSRLYRSLVAEKMTAVNAMATTYNLKDYGIFLAGAALSPNSDNYERIHKELETHIETIKKTGPTDKELTKARNQMLSDVVKSNLTIDSKASTLATAAVVQGDISKVNQKIGMIKSVTIEGIKSIANKYLAPEQAFKITVKQNNTNVSKENEYPEPLVYDGPDPKIGRGDLKRPADYPRKPPVKEVTPFDITPKIERAELLNGLEIITVPNHEVPFVTAMIGFDAGAWTESKPGTASMTMRMLTKGTEKYTEEQLSEILDTYAIELNGSADMDNASIHCSFLTDQTDRAIELLAQAALAPSFEKVELEKLRQQTLTSLTVALQEPDYLAEKHLKKVLYDPTNPYSRTVEGEIDDVKALTTEDLKNWWSLQIKARPDSAVLIFAGDIRHDLALELAREHFSKWQNISTQVPTKPETAKALDHTHIYLYDRPGSIQSQIRIAQPAITRHDQPEYFTSRLVSNYFGWSFNSRLNKSIRVDKGLTYFVNGSYIANRFDGIFKVDTFTKPETTAKTVQSLLEEIQKLKTMPPTPEELEDGKQYITGSFIRNRETPQQTARDLWLIESQNLSNDYLDRLLAEIASTTETDCTNLIRKTIDPDKMAIVVVGDAKIIKDKLEEIAPVTIITDQPCAEEKTQAVNNI
jgi:zinc protease